jgi:hypothetical protein
MNTYRKVARGATAANVMDIRSFAAFKKSSGAFAPRKVGELSNRVGVIERQKGISSRESHGHQELSRVKKVHAVFAA